MRKTRIILWLLLGLLLLTACGAGEDQAASQSVSSSPVPASVTFAAGEVPADARELTLTLQPGETALLDQLPALTSLDARGSACYEELAAWGQAHPEVALRYTVPVPGLGELENDTETVDLTGLAAADAVEAAQTLALLPELEQVSLPGGETGMTLEQALAFARTVPQAVIDYPFTLYGQSVNLSDDSLVLFHIPVEDEGEAVRQVLPCMRACTWVDMDNCGVSNENMARIRDENPEVEVIWRVWFGESYSVRTNVTKILASMPSQGGRVDDNNCQALRYCTNVRYLDLGHNPTLSDFSFIRYMPELEVAVISMAAVEDISPFASCPKLLYLEMGNTKVGDLSPLAACTELRHLNIGTNINITDISPLYGLDLKRLWIGTYTPVPEEQVEEMQRLHPGCDINTTVPSGLEIAADGGAANEGYTIEWKSYQPPIDGPVSQPIGWYKVIVKCFGYNHGAQAYSFYWNDPKYTGSDPTVKPVNVAVMDTSFLKEDWEDPHSLEPEDPDAPPGGILYELEH